MAEEVGLPRPEELVTPSLRSHLLRAKVLPNIKPSGGLTGIEPKKREPSPTPEGRALELASTREHILIEGEAGTGKRYYALLIHRKSRWTRGGSCVEVTAQTSDGELKAILFDEDRKRTEGILGRPVARLTSRNTLLVHHINEFSFLNQTRLARYLIQNHDATAGASRPPRVIITTLLPWRDTIRQRSIIESLQDYLNSFELLVIPPLRDRSGEVPAIVRSILKELTTETGKGRFSMRPDALETLEKHQWLDNVRELRHLLLESAMSSTNGVVTLPDSFYDEVESVARNLRMIQTGKPVVLEDLLTSLERTLIQRALMRCNSKLADAARLLGLTEKNLRYRMRKYGLRISGSRGRM